MDNESGNVLDGAGVADVFERAFAVPEGERILDHPASNKFYVLDTLARDKGFVTGYFTSAKYNHRPDLISKANLKRRANPKLMEEGESERTHFGLRCLKKDAILALEAKTGGISLGALMRYLKQFTTDATHLEYDLFASANFVAKLQHMIRATSITIYSSRDIIHPTFGMSRELPDMQDTVVITFKAKKLGSIKRYGAQMYGWLSRRSGPDVTRVRVFGKSEDNDDVIIDSEKLADFEYLQADLDANGQVVSDSFIPRLKSMLQSSS